MSKYDELKRLAEASRVANHDERGPDEAFHEALHPEVVLSLIAENERLLKILERTVEQYVPLAELDGVPGWSRVVKLNEVCAERNQLRAEIAGLRTGYQACERVNAELKDEVEKVDSDRNACWAEFKVQGRYIDQLKAENDALRQDAERYQFLMLSFVGDEGSPPAGYYVIYEDGCGFGEILCGDEATREIDAAMAQGEQP